MKLPVLIIWIWGLVDELDEELLLLPLPPLPPPPLAPPPPPEDEPLDPLLVRPEPVPVPLMLLPEVPVPLNCWPTVRLTTATVPSMGAVSDAPVSPACALASCACAA